MRVAAQRTLVCVFLFSFALLLGSAAAAQAQGTITGRVTAEDNKESIGDARVIALGTNVFTVTNAEGRYTLRNVPAGAREIRVLRVGYTELKKTVTVPASGNVNLDFSLAASVVKLQEVVTTATGEQRKVELGNTVATIDVASRVAEAPVKNFGDLLAAKAPGVQVLPGNMTAGGSRVRIRGTNSVALSNDPIYVIDGIRMTSGNGTNIGVGGTAPNRVNDINPEEIENIEIVKGPSAATLYGTDAANGVIVITTKRGRAGAPRWTVFGEHGVINDRNDYPAQYAILGKTPGSATQRKCLLKELSVSNSTQCVMDSVTVNNIFKNQDLTMIKLGIRDNYGAQVSGGTENVRYFVSIDNQKETGPFGMPAFSERRLQDTKTAMLGEWGRPNALGQTSFRANMNIAVNPQLDLTVSTGFVRLDQRLPQVDNNVNSFWYNAMMGPGWTGAGPGYTGVGSLGQPLMGYLGYTPAEMFQYTTSQNLQRFISSVNANWRPLGWFQARADVGMDLSDRDDYQIIRFGQGSDFGTNRLGTAADSRANIRNFSTNVSGTATWQARSWLNVKSTLGVQYINFKNDGTTARGSTLPPGAQTPAQGTIPSIGSGTTQQNTLGAFFEAQAAIRDRLYMTAAVRSDQNSAFGTNFQRAYYPKASLSWVASDEDFFPHLKWLDQLRLRVSSGASGVQPGPTDALRSFSTTTTSIAGTDVSGLRSNLLGNPELKPERTSETELGFDAKLLNSRVNLEVTYYNKHTEDALFSLTIAPSAGTSVSSVRYNLGGTQNTGIEMLLNAQVVDRRALGIDMTLSLSHNGNKLVSLGKDFSGKPLPTVGLNTTVQQAAGYPVSGYWSRPFTYADANNDGIITPNEVQIDTVWRFRGYSQPRDEISLTTGVELLQRRLRINILADYKGGSNLFNNEEGFLCQQSTSCPYTSSLHPSLYNQARTVAERDFGTLNTQWGYAEPLRFWRLREVSATYTLADQWATRYLRAKGASVNLGVRNIKVWTKYTGVDPEANYGEGNTQQTLLTAGPPTYFQFRLNLRY